MNQRIFRPKEQGERGATAVMVAVMMTVLLGCLAFVVDIGLITAEKVQLQTGADAAALAVAQDCLLKGTPACTATAAATAQDFAKTNNAAGMAGIKPPEFPSPESVKITTTAKNSGGDGVVMTFARFLGVDTVQVSATATAAWGGPYAGATALPIVISECQFNLSGNIQVVKLENAPSCTSADGTGTAIPGGFGWLDSDPGKCGLALSLAKPTISSSAGLGTPSLCKPTFESLKNETILLPVYDRVFGTGTNVTYRIKGFAAFELRGYNFSGLEWNSAGPPSCTGDCKGLIGKFVRFVIPDASWTDGGPNLGAARIRLTQ